MTFGVNSIFISADTQIADGTIGIAKLTYPGTFHMGSARITSDATAAGATEYCGFEGAGLASAWSANENLIFCYTGAAALIKKIYVYIYGNGVSATSTYTLMVAGSPSALSISINAGQTGYFDAVSTAGIAVAKNEKISLKCVAGAGGTTIDCYSIGLVGIYTSLA